MSSIWPDPPHSSPAALRASTRRRYGREWLVTLDGVEHRVALSHSNGGLATKVHIDEELVYRHGSLDTITSSADIPLALGDHSLLIAIRSRGFTGAYSLVIDGQLLDGPDPSAWTVADEKDRDEFLHALFVLFVLAPLIYFFGKPAWRLGPFPLDQCVYGAALISAASLIARFFTSRKGRELPHFTGSSSESTTEEDPS